MDRRNFMKYSMASSFGFGLVKSIFSRDPIINQTYEELSDEWVMLYLDDQKRQSPFKVRKGVKQPHIFLITADMISPDCYLSTREISKYINLKSIRSIGESGTQFNNAFCTIPLCGPSRASIFTGLYPPYLTNGERALQGMKKNLEQDDLIFQQYLKKSGYTTKHVGKCHVGSSKFIQAFGENDSAWDRWAPPLLEDDQYVDFLQEKGVEPFVYKKEIRGKLFDRKTSGNFYGGWIQQKNGKDFPLEAHYSVYLAEKAISKMDAAFKQTPESPLYLQLDLFDPHQPFSIPSGFEARAEELRRVIKLPKSYGKVARANFNSLPNEPSIYSLYRRYWGAYDPELVLNYIICHLLQMEIVDYAIGLFLDEIKKRVIWDDSLIIFMGDHGEMNGRLGLFDKGVYFHPDIFRIPLFVKSPKCINHSIKIYQNPVSSMDVCPTVLSFAGIDIMRYLDGEDLMPVVKGESDRTILEQIFQTGWHVGVNYGVGYQIYDSADSHWFYGYSITTGEEELYNMAIDDCENLINDSKYENIRKRIVNKLAEILMNDKRWLGYWSTFNIHNAKYLPLIGGDNQMIIPNK